MLSELWSDLRYRGRALFRRGQVERELEQELQFHLERETDRQIQAGLSPEEARLRARAAFGGVERVKEESRDGRGLVLLEAASQDLRYALRALRRSPGFTAAVILTLGLGIGANAAMFGVVDRLLFRPPAYLTDAQRVQRVYLSYQHRGKEYINASMEYTRYLDLGRWTRSFSTVAGYSQRDMAVGTGPDAREMNVQAVSAAFFDLFDAQPALGRFFVASEDTLPVGASVAVISDAYWRTAYGGSRDVLGKALQVGPVSYTIIGVAPKGFVGIPDEGPTAVFLPITTYAGNAGNGAPSDYYSKYQWGWMQMLARRKPGISIAAATADLSQAYLRSWDAERTLSPENAPASIARPRAIAAPVLEERGPNQTTVAKVAAWTSGVAVIVLLIACANVANLLLARAVRRRREIALRLALGVSRRRLATQLLIETLLLGGIGGVAGLLIAHWGGAMLHALFLPAGTNSTSLLDPRTLVFAAGAALLAGGLTGLAPVLQANRSDLVDALKAGVREGTHRHSRARSVLLLSQGALSVVLLVGAGLFVRSLQNVRALRLGYDVSPVVYVEPHLRGAKLTDDERTALNKRLLQAAQALPGVKSASLGLTVPFWNTWTQGLFVTGIDSVHKLGEFTLQAGSPEYFETVGTRILRGRGFTAADSRDAPKVTLVSEGMARTIWPGQDAIGKCMRMNADTAPCITVVGVTENIKQNSLSDDPGLQYYLPIEQFHLQEAGLFLRVGGDAELQKENLRREFQPLMPGTGYVTVTPMRDIIDPNLRSWQLGATMFLAFGGMALVLAAIGLYSVIAYDVAQRTHELGVRIALGARLGDVVRLVMGDGVRFALIGVGIGSAIALAAGQWIRPLLFDVSPRDPLVFGAVSAVLMGVAALASLTPALRATKVDPSVALRAD